MQVGTGNEERIYDVAKNVTKELNLQREESHILDATQEAPETGGHFGAHIDSGTTMQVGTA